MLKRYGEYLKENAMLIAEARALPYDVVCPNGECICKELKGGSLGTLIVLVIMMLLGLGVAVQNALPAMAGNLEEVDLVRVVLGATFALISGVGIYFLLKRGEIFYYQKMEVYENPNTGEMALLLTSGKMGDNVVLLRPPRIGGDDALSSFIGNVLRVKDSGGQARIKVEVKRCGPYVLVKFFEIERLKQLLSGRRKALVLTASHYRYALKGISVMNSSDAQRLLKAISKAKEEIYFAKDPNLKEVVIEL